MSFDQILQPLLILELVILGLILAFLYYLEHTYSLLRKKRLETEKEFSETLKKANTRYQHTLEEASEKASQILSATQFVRSSIQEKIDRHLASLSEKSSVYLKNELSKITESSINQTKKELEKIQQQTLEQIKNFDKDIQKELADTHTSVNSEITNRLQQVQKDLESYKEEQIALVDQKIKKTVVEISEEVLGKAISLQDQEKLVIDALEEVKKQGAFR